MSYKSGTDLILGVVQEVNKVPTFFPLGFSAGCKISDSTETGERKTKEAPDSGWKESYVKSLAESIQADGFVYDNLAASSIGLPTLKELWLNKAVVTLRYKYRDQAANAGLYQGNFVIANLDDDAPAGDDEKWSVTFQNSGAVAPVS